MRNLLAGTALAALAIFIVNQTSKVDDVALRHHDMLNPSVLINVRHAAGSGTVVHSGPDGVFILTNHHVMASEEKQVADDLAEEKKQDADATANPVIARVRDWIFYADRKSALPLEIDSTLVNDDPEDDLALLKVNDSEYRADVVARFIDPSDEPQISETAFASGGGMGNRPFITEGLVSLTSLDNHNGAEGKIMISAPIISGNSGGGAYVLRGKHYVFFGVPEAISEHPWSVKTPFGSLPVGVGVAHMGIVIPMDTVRAFLAKSGLKEFQPRPTQVVSR